MNGVLVVGAMPTPFSPYQTTSAAGRSAASCSNADFSTIAPTNRHCPSLRGVAIDMLQSGLSG